MNLSGLLFGLALPGISIALAGGMYDGTYHGQLTGGGSNPPVCAKSAPAQITVTDSKLEYIHMGHATITATVAADGSFSGSAQNNYAGGPRATPQVQTLQGKIAGGAIAAETNVGNYCKYTLQLKRF
jgi:hypothetical protein